MGQGSTARNQINSRNCKASLRGFFYALESRSGGHLQISDLSDVKVVWTGSFTKSKEGLA